MIVHDLGLVCISIPPNETEPPLIVDSYAVLTLAVAAQSLKVVAGRGRKITKFSGAIQLPKFPASNPFYGRKSPTRHAVMKPLSLRAAETPDHKPMILRYEFNVNR